MLRKALRATTLTIVVGTLGHAVTVAADEGSHAPVHVEGQGALSTMSGSGSVIVDAPVPRPYWVSFGAATPCMATDPGESTEPVAPDDVIVITGVRYVDRHNPAAEVRVLLRTVTPKMVRNHPNLKDRFGVFYSALGHAGQHQRYGTYVPGRYSTDIAGYEVSDTCREMTRNAARLSMGRVPDEPLTTLVFAVKADKDGARLHHWFVDYTVNGEERTLRVNWTMGAQRPRTLGQ